jgi:Skp family chaperone for outer membrane proteins
MKTRTLLAMGLCAAIGLFGAQKTFAQHDHKEGEKHEEKGAKAKIPDTVEGIFKEIHEHHAHLAETVKSKKLADVHHLAFAIRDLANALPAKAAADKKTQVQGTVKNIAKLAEDLDASGDANDQAKTEANLKKLDGLIKVLETQFGIKAQVKEEHQH